MESSQKSQEQEVVALQEFLGLEALGGSNQDYLWAIPSRHLSSLVAMGCPTPRGSCHMEVMEPVECLVEPEGRLATPQALV